MITSYIKRLEILSKYSLDQLLDPIIRKQLSELLDGND